MITRCWDFQAPAKKKKKNARQLLLTLLSKLMASLCWLLSVYQPLGNDDTVTSPFYHLTLLFQCFSYRDACFKVFVVAKKKKKNLTESIFRNLNVIYIKLRQWNPWNAGLSKRKMWPELWKMSFLPTLISSAATFVNLQTAYWMTSYLQKVPRRLAMEIPGISETTE